MISTDIANIFDRILMRPSRLVVLALVTLTSAAVAQDNPSGDPVVQRIYDEGMHRSETARLAQVLMDSIGPRLTGSPANRAANEWLLLGRYRPVNDSRA